VQAIANIICALLTLRSQNNVLMMLYN